MAIIVNNVNVFPQTFPQPSTAAVGSILNNNGTSAYWAYPGSPQSAPAGGLRYRSIFTHGYLAGGYKGSCPWRAVNRTWHATDITMYCGEQLAYAANYLEGTFSDYNGYIHNTADAYATASAGTQSYSLANGTLRTQGGGTYSPPGSGFGFPSNTGTSGVGGWNLSSSRGPYIGCAVNQIGQVGYIAGGSGTAVCDKFYMPAEIMFNTNGMPAAGGMTSGAHGENRGYFASDGGYWTMTYSNDSWASWGNPGHNSTWCKFLSTKWGHHYGTTNQTVILKFSDSNGAAISSGTSKPSSSSEENFQMGQDWGYMLGNYDGQQNNDTQKYNHSNDTSTRLGAAARPKGHFGQSSACCASAAASIAMNNYSPF